MAKDYGAIARARITSPKRAARKPRFLVYGRNKRGKTRFCTSAPNVLVLDPEQGTEEEKRIDPDVWPVSTWEDLTDAIGFMRTGGKSPLTGQPYEWMAWDGLTRIATIALHHVKRRAAERDLTRLPEHVDKRDYGNANEMMKEAIAQAHALRNIGIIFTAQERMVEVSNMEDLDDDDAAPAGWQYLPDLPKGARGAFNQVVDVIGRIYVVRGDFERTVRVRNKTTGKTTVKTIPTKTERRLWIGPHDMYDTGYRSSYDLPDFIRQPTVASLMSAMHEGKVDQ